MTRKQTKLWIGRVTVSSSLVLVAGGGIFAAETASASSTSKMGVITGALKECPPDAAWGRVSPNPAMVVLVHKGRTYDSQSVAFPKKAPWSGVFSFSVQPGTYQVVSSYQGAAPTVAVKAGGKATVSFGVIGCPG